MNLKQNIQQAITNILSAKLRSFLAVLGILVGTGSVVALVSGGQLATKKALDQVRALGSDLMAINVNNISNNHNRFTEEELQVDDVHKMSEYLPYIKRIAPYASAYSQVHYEGSRVGSSIVGATDDLQDTVKINIARGRFISFVDKYEYFCVIGAKVFTKIYAAYKGDVIGKQIKVGDFYFTIVGVADYWDGNTFFNSDVNSSVIIPIHMAKIISKYSSIRDIIIRHDEKINIDVVQEDVTDYFNMLSANYKVDFRSAKQIQKQLENQDSIFTLLLGMIGGVSLLVGGIGIMNVMLVSVVERKREIGIRMAVGAKRKDIRSLFLIESVTLTVSGGIMGIIAGILVSYVVALLSGWDFAIFLLPPLLGFIVSCVTGVFFGFYPAYSASKLDPIQTLRHE